MADYYSDFSLKCGSWTGSFLYLCRSITVYILMPLAMIALIRGIGPHLTTMIGGAINISSLFEQFVEYFNRYILYSIPLIFLSIFIGYYPAGNYARIPFKFLSAVYLAIMLLMFTDGGHLAVTLDGEALASTGITGIDLTLDIVGVIYILAIISFVRGFLAFTEFSDNRKDYLEKLAKKFNKKDKKNKNSMDFDEDDEKPRKKQKAPVEDDDDI